jgi:hypothetical protein
MRPTAGAIAVIFLISTALVTGVSAQQRHGGGGGGGGFSAAPHGGGGGGGGGFSAAPVAAVVVVFLHRPVCPRRRFRRPVSQRRARPVLALRLLA